MKTELQNTGFYAKLTTKWSEGKRIDWYNDLEKLVDDVYMIGLENISVITECKQVTRDEYEAIHKINQ